MSVWHSIGWVLVVISVYFEALSYYKQIKKTLREHDSEDVSSSAYMAKIIKYIFTIFALIIFANWIGLMFAIIALVLCIVTLYFIIKYKPKKWRWYR